MGRLEAWAVQALAAAIDPDLRVATGPFAEGELRSALDAQPTPEVRRGGTPS